MIDLIKRLRDRAARKWTDEANRSASLFGEAADEIERLTAERDAARLETKQADARGDEAMRRAHAAEAAIDAARESNHG